MDVVTRWISIADIYRFYSNLKEVLGIIADT